MSSLPSGIRLMNLLREHLMREIMDRERGTEAQYTCISYGSLLVAFERSAYQLHRAFSDGVETTAAPARLPVPGIVMVSVTDRSLRSYAREHILRRDGVGLQVG